jgi:hypothetical protein
MMNCTANPYLISLGVNASFLAFYTGYSKATKSYTPSSIVTVLTFGKGVDHTLVELNKSISLSGLSTLCLAFLPPFSDQKAALIKHSMGMLSVHTIYSLYKYYGSKNIPAIKEWFPFSSTMLTDLRNRDTRPRGIKKLSLWFGLISQTLLWSDYLKLTPAAKTNAAYATALITGTLHFYFMEIDFKWILQVRPFAKLPFPLAAVSAWFAYRF